MLLMQFTKSYLEINFNILKKFIGNSYIVYINNHIKAKAIFVKKTLVIVIFWCCACNICLN